jgi:hypothetical protein
MVFFHDKKFFTHVPNGQIFDQLHDSGRVALYAGIYACDLCGFEIVMQNGKELPLEDDCTRHGFSHPPILHNDASLSRVRWRLIATPEDGPN